MWKCKHCSMCKPMRKNYAGNQRGYLLLEALLSLPWLIIVTSVLLSLLHLSMNVLKQQENQCEVQYFCRSAIQLMDADVKQGKGCKLLNNGYTLMISGQEEQYTYYYLEDEQIYREIHSENGKTKAPICAHIDSAHFALTPSGLIQISIEGKKQNGRFQVMLSTYNQCEISE